MIAALLASLALGIAIGNTVALRQARRQLRALSDAAITARNRVDDQAELLSGHGFKIEHLLFAEKAYRDRLRITPYYDRNGVLRAPRGFSPAANEGDGR